MKHIFFLVMLFVAPGKGIYAQKPQIDSEAIVNWPTIQAEAISNDGKYFLYPVSCMAGNESEMKNYVVIKSTVDTFSRIIPGSLQAWFSGDSHFAFVRVGNDSLFILDLPNRKTIGYGGVSAVDFPKSGQSNWLTVQFGQDSLWVLNPGSNQRKTFTHVKSHEFSKRGRYLSLIQTGNEPGSSSNALSILNLETGQLQQIWTGATLGQLAMDEEGRQFAFIAPNDKGQTAGYSIWYYKEGMTSAGPWIKDAADQSGDLVDIQNGRIEFAPQYGALLFHVKRKGLVTEKAYQGDAAVQIWSYSDAFEKIDSERSKTWASTGGYLAIAYTGSPLIITLGHQGDGVADPFINHNGKYPFAFVISMTNQGEGYRSITQRPDIYLINIRDGSRICIKKQLYNGHPEFSLGGKYLFWYDQIDRNYFAYNLERGKLVNISIRITTDLYDDEWGMNSPPGGYNNGNWFEDDKAVLINDKYDIWKVDPDGETKPVNLTNGYGRAHKTILREVHFDWNYYWKNQAPLKESDSILFCGFNEINRQNGFFKGDPKKAGNPLRLLMSPDVYYFPQNIKRTTRFQYGVLKAENADLYLLRKMNATDYPNIYITTDFKKLSQASQLEPQQHYNWLKAELVHWKTFSGKPGEGILYKPEDFDSTKKYPVIFYFYERLTSGLNIFVEPEEAGGPINIPWYVSRGYLVLCPDIYYPLGDPEAGIYDYVVSAASYMVKKPWVDARHMGIQGHSWGGYEVNVLITKTNLFAAGISASGFSDMVSEYGLEGFSFCSGPSFTEAGPDRMVKGVFDRPLMYIANSPVFGVKKVTTPLLMMANPKDRNVPWEQGLEFFTVLRRLNKKVWMLEYQHDAHSVSGAAAWDYTARMTQFFDHYLKGKAAPQWMTVKARESTGRKNSY